MALIIEEKKLRAMVWCLVLFENGWNRVPRVFGLVRSVYFFLHIGAVPIHQIHWISGTQ
jgi:hypothetical protein